MRVLLQKVLSASVTVDKQTIGAIDRGYLLFVGVGHEDTQTDADKLAKKITGLRLFPNDQGKLDHDLLTIGGGVLVVPQFTLMARCTKGRRPDFTQAGPPHLASPMCDYFAQTFAPLGIEQVQTGQFGADMKVSIENDGPFTLWLDSKGL